MTNNKDTKRLIVVIPQTLHIDLKMLAVRTGKSMKQIVTSALLNELKKSKQK